MRNGSPADFARRFPGLDPAVVLPILMGPYHEDTDHPWHRLERGEVTLAEARAANLAAFEAAGVGAAAAAHGAGLRGERGDGRARPRPARRRPADRPAHEQRPRAARPLVGAAPLRRAVRRRGRQPRGRDAQAQPRHLPARPGRAWARPRTAPRSWTTSPATWPPRWRRGWSACWSRATAPHAIAHVRELAGSGLSSWRRRRGEAVDGAGAGLVERGLGRPERGPGRDDVVDDQHRARTRRRATKAGPARRSWRERPVCGGPSSTRRSRPRHGTPSRHATARASTSAWS